MIFKQWQQVLNGAKTQTRRLIKPTDEYYGSGRPKPHGIPIVCVFNRESLRRKYVVGKTYAIQPGRGKKAVGRFKLLAIHREWLQDISLEDTLAEGIFQVPEAPDFWKYSGSIWWFVSPREAFFVLWDSIYKKRSDRSGGNPEVWGLTLKCIASHDVS